MRVLVADDDRSLCAAVAALLVEEGYEVDIAKDGREAVALFGANRPDVVVLDVMMPKMDGFDACRGMRQVDSAVPILMLSAKGDIVDKKTGFRSGADDYLVKPFDDEELLLRVGALLDRRAREETRLAEVIAASGPAAGRDPMSSMPSGQVTGRVLGIPDDGVLHAEGIEIDFRRFEVAVGDRTVQLAPKEFGLLATLATHPGEVFTREELVAAVWGAEYDAETVSIPVYIRRLREKVEEDPSTPRYVQTVWRYGYRFGD